MDEDVDYSVMPGTVTNLDAVAVGQNWKCGTCIGEHLNFLVKQVKGEQPEDAQPPEIKDAVTLAPSWQSNMVMGQMVMACVPLPTCMGHIQVSELTAEQRALLGGIMLGRPGQAG